jgi:hypothetical protein
VVINPRKTEALKRWPTIYLVKELKGFLRLVGYYRKFFRICSHEETLD